MSVKVFSKLFLAVMVFCFFTVLYPIKAHTEIYLVRAHGYLQGDVDNIWIKYRRTNDSTGEVVERRKLKGRTALMFLLNHHYVGYDKNGRMFLTQKFMDWKNSNAGAGVSQRKNYANIVGSWDFGRTDGSRIGVLTFSDRTNRNGFFEILEPHHPNETFWTVSDSGILYIMHRDGRVTSTLYRKNLDYWQGPYHPHPSMGTPARPVTHWIKRH